MKSTSKVIVLLACLLVVSVAEAGMARPASWNYTLMGIGGAAMVFGLAGLLATSVACPPALAAFVLTAGAVAVGTGSVDEIREVITDKPVESSFLSDIKSEGWDEVNETLRRQLDQDERRQRRMEGERQFKQNIKKVGRWFRDLFGVKSASAGELEPLQPIGQFISENSADKIRNRGKPREQRKKDSPKHGRKEETKEKSPKSGSTLSQPDLHSLDLDDVNGDWCKCAAPGCSANMDVKNGLVIFGCTKCKKVNVQYAKMALELEQKMKAAGEEGEWRGHNAEASAHKAAGK